MFILIGLRLKLREKSQYIYSFSLYSTMTIFTKYICWKNLFEMLHYLNLLSQHFLKITHGTHKGQNSLGKQNIARFQQRKKNKTKVSKINRYSLVMFLERSFGNISW